MKPKYILCVCIGNRDRSPVMAAVLEMLLRRAGHNASCVSAGVAPNTQKRLPPGEFAIMAAKSLGLDISQGTSCHIDEIGLTDFDLIICVDDKISGTMIEAGVDPKKVYNANITNPWPCQFAEDYLPTFQAIVAAMVKVVWRYFPVTEQDSSITKP